MANPRPAKYRVLGATTIITVTAPVHYPAAARTKTSTISVQLFTYEYKIFAALLMLTPKRNLFELVLNLFKRMMLNDKSLLF